MVSVALPGLWFTGYDVEEDLSPNYIDGKEKCKDLMDFLAIMIAFFGLFTVIFFKNKPETPPSYVANV